MSGWEDGRGRWERQVDELGHAIVDEVEVGMQGRQGDRRGRSEEVERAPLQP